MKKRKLKKNVKYGFYAIVFVILSIFILIKYISYKNSTEYKLKEIGYSKEQTTEIMNLKSDIISKILESEYNENILVFIKEKYFLLKNLDEYLKLYSECNCMPNKVISLVNTKANHEYYDENIITETDTSKNELMLVNKYHYLTEDYNPNVESISVMYAYSDNELREEALNAYIKMWKSANIDGVTLIAASSYRTYEEQKGLWNSRAIINKKEADSSTARAGFSEHQTGLAIDILTYNATLSNFEETDAFKWLKDNAHKYGFILRYPKDKEDITGYEYESWHYRYVGIEVATKIHKENITFDEYYAYYIE